MRITFAILFVILGFNLFAVDGEKVITINDDWDALNLNEYTYAFISKIKNLEADSVKDEKFEHLPTGLNIGLNDKIYWARYSINNPYDVSKEFYLFYPYNDINKINVFLIYHDSIEYIKSTGTFYSKSNKDLKSRGYPISLKLKPGLTKVLIEVEHLYLPLRGIAFLLTEDQVIDNTIETQALLSMWQGILLFILILTFILYFALEQKSFLYYSILNLGILLFFNAEVGDYFFFFDADPLDHIIDIKHFANILVLVFLPLFINQIASVAKASPQLWKIMTYGLYIGPIAWAICLIPSVKDTYFLYYTTMYFIIGSAILFLLLLYFTFIAYRKKHPNALGVFIIYVVYFSAAFKNLILPNMGAKDSELLVYNSFIFGSLFEIIAFLGLLGKETLSV